MSKLEDVKQKAVPVMLDKERSLLFDLNAMADLEDKYGSMQKAMKSMTEGSIKAIRALIWAGLKHEDEALTERQVGAMLTMVDMEDVSMKLAEAMEKCMPAVPKAIKKPHPNK